jgi:hypothetical protein
VHYKNKIKLYFDTSDAVANMLPAESGKSQNEKLNYDIT